jgi:transposase InsO family protein
MRRLCTGTAKRCAWSKRTTSPRAMLPWSGSTSPAIMLRMEVLPVTHRLRAMGIRDKPIAPGSPWQNGFAERLIGSIRRECVDHVVALGERHLRRILTKYAAYYNRLRTHRSLNKDAPIHRAIQRVGPIGSAPLLGGLHHHYCRI